MSKPVAAAIVITVEFWTFVESRLGSGPLPVTGNQVGTGGAAYHHTRGLDKSIQILPQILIFWNFVSICHMVETKEVGIRRGLMRPFVVTVLM